MTLNKISLFYFLQSDNPIDSKRNSSSLGGVCGLESGDLRSIPRSSLKRFSPNITCAIDAVTRSGFTV